MRTAIIVCLLLAYLSVYGRADTYQWKDENGGIHVSNIPPAGIDKSKIERIEVSEDPPASKIREEERSLRPLTGQMAEEDEPARESAVTSSSHERSKRVFSYLIDLFALVLIALFAYRGYRQGTLLMSLGILRLLCAYAGAYLLAGLVGIPLHAIFGLLRIVATAVAGILIFLIITIGFKLLTRKIRRKRKIRKLTAGWNELALPNRIGGGILGLLCGVVTVFVLCWLYNLIGAGFAESKQPDISSSFSNRSSQYVIEEAAYVGIGVAGGEKEDARQIARLISKPAGTVEDFRRLVSIPSVALLMNSRTFQADFLSGNYRRIRFNSDLQRIFNDKDAVRYLKELGVIPDDYRSPLFQNRLAKNLARAGSRMQEAMNDPELHSTVEELRREGLLNTGRISALILDTRFLKIVDRALAPDESPP